MFQCWEKWNCPLCMGIKQVSVERVSTVELWKHLETVAHIGFGHIGEGKNF